MRRTKEEATATRELLLDSAELEFERHGVAATTLQHIATAAGLTRGAIYHHFADKPALIEAMLARIDLPLEAAMLAVEARQDAQPLSQLRQLALEPLDLLQRDEHARRVFTILLHRVEYAGDMAPLLMRHRASLSDCSLRIERLFSTAQRQRHLRPGTNPRQATLALMALVDGLLRMATFNDDHRPVCASAPAAVDALLAGFQAPGLALTAAA